ncbi:MAG: TerC family protein [Bdellovibrionales bacterium]|jgi:CBS domain containing-hemolysin-like protein|nr:TerC family protein [Bdellovibrionales bacterium]
MLDFSWVVEPTAWAGFLTLVILELILGIDNLVFIAILADKLPPKQRDKARNLGLMLALLMRVVLLAAISWMVKLTEPMFTVADHPISGRDLILLLGGLFLLFKATMEIHGRLEGKGHKSGDSRYKAKFWMVIAQILVLDAVFSLDSVITAVGMAEHLSMMVAAVVIAMILMIIMARPLANFVNAHPTVVMLCLGFLLMVGFALVAEGLGATIPKGYLYAAIGFSVGIEAINQFAQAKLKKRVKQDTDVKARTADAILRMLGAKPAAADGHNDMHEAGVLLQEAGKTSVLSDAEKDLLRGVLNLSARPVHTIMTPRIDLEYINIQKPTAEIFAEVKAMNRSHILVSDGEMDNVMGILRRDDFLVACLNTDNQALTSKILHEPLIVQKRASVLELLEIFRKQAVEIAVVVDEFGSVEGVVTHVDLLESIAGEFPDMDAPGEQLIAPQEDGTYLIDGMASIYDVRSRLNVDYEPDGRFATIAGLVLHELGRFPQQGDSMPWGGYVLHVEKMDGRRIDTVRAVRITEEAEDAV